MTHPDDRPNKKYKVTAVVVFKGDADETYMPFEPVAAPDRFEAVLKIAKVLVNLGHDGMAFELNEIAVSELT
jgi:hypothetical protein